MGNLKFQELYIGFKRSISRGTILEFIKKRILAPNDIQYLECGNYIDIIDLKNKRAYVFAHLDFKNLDEYDNHDIINETMEKVHKVLKNNRILGISKNKNTVFVIGKNAIFYVYFDKKLHKHTVSFITNKKVDEDSFVKFLAELAKVGILYKTK